MNPEQLIDQMEGILARNSIKWTNTEIDGDEIIIWYDIGESDPSLIVQVIERGTPADYQGETNQVTETKGLRFKY